MNLSIFDVDGIGSKTIDKNEIKTFIKNATMLGKSLTLWLKLASSAREYAMTTR